MNLRLAGKSNSKFKTIFVRKKNNGCTTYSIRRRIRFPQPRPYFLGNSLFAKMLMVCKRIYDQEAYDINFKMAIRFNSMLQAFVDAFGISLTSIKYELASHVETIEKHGEVLDEFMIFHLFQAIYHEIESGGFELTEAVMWANRYLEFIKQVIMRLFEEGFENEAMNRSVENILQESYKETLAQYRDWTSQKIFKALIAKSPKKKNVIKKLLMNSKSNKMDLLAIAMEGCVEVFTQLIEGFKAMYAESNLEQTIERSKVQALIGLPGPLDIQI